MTTTTAFFPPTPPLSGDDFECAREPSPIADGSLGAPWARAASAGVRLERKLGDSELSYYLPSRADGVNDM